MITLREDAAVTGRPPHRVPGFGFSLSPSLHLCKKALSTSHCRLIRTVPHDVTKAILSSAPEKCWQGNGPSSSSGRGFLKFKLQGPSATQLF